MRKQNESSKDKSTHHQSRHQDEQSKKKHLHPGSLDRDVQNRKIPSQKMPEDE